MSGGRYSPSLCFVGCTHKQQFSAFTGIASIRADVADKRQATIYAGADVYVSDFGAISIVPHPYGMGADASFVDPDMAAVATLDGVRTADLAKGGDSERFIMTAEKTLVCRNEKAHAVIRALS